MLKPDVVPHKALNVPSTSGSSQLTSSARKRKEQNVEGLLGRTTSPKKTRRALFTSDITPSKKNVTIENESVSPSGSFQISDVRSVSVAVQVSLKPKTRTVETSTEKYQKSRGTETDAHLLFKVPQIYGSPAKSTATSESEFAAQSSSSSELSSDLAESQQKSLLQSRKDTTLMIIEKNPKLYLGIPVQAYILVNFLSKWTKVSHTNIMITLKKIKQNDSFSRMSDDFAISAGAISTIFRKSVPQIASVLQNFVYWPSNDKIKQLLPIPFRFRYHNVVSIIDCFEIEIEKPSQSVKQALTWSEYKKCNTLKFLVSCTPNGFINFISGAYGGRISDRLIVVESGYLNNLPNNVDVMADRGFKHIAALLAEKNCNLVRPPSVSLKEKSSALEIKESKRIAALRAHVERLIRRLREFEMLHMHTVVHKYLMYLMNSIVIIACALVNLQEPLLR